MMLFPAMLMNFPNSKVCLIGEWSIGWRQTLTTSPPNLIRLCLFVRKKSWKTGFKRFIDLCFTCMLLNISLTFNTLNCFTELLSEPWIFIFTILSLFSNDSFRGAACTITQSRNKNKQEIIKYNILSSVGNNNG